MLNGFHYPLTAKGLSTALAALSSAATSKLILL